MPENTIGGRLDKIIDYFHINAKQFASEIDISDGHLSDIRHGNRTLSRKVSYSIYVNYGINEHWLKTGEGEMFSHQWPLRMAEKSEPYGLTARLLKYMEKIKVVYYEGSLEEKAQVIGILDVVHDNISRRKEVKDESYTQVDDTKDNPFQEEKESIKKPA